MNVIVVTSKSPIKNYFASLERARTVTCSFEKPGLAKELMKNTPPGYLVYLDLSSFKTEEWKKLVQSALQYETLRLGIIDPSGAVKDRANLFHRGAADYLDKYLLEKSITSKRIKEVYAYKPVKEVPHESAATVIQKEWKLPENGWKGIKSGQEYTFTMLYVELDLLPEWKKSGKAHINEIQTIFHNHMDRVFTPLGGKLWMWMDQSGIILFPFDGSTCSPFIPCVKMILNRVLSSIEIYRYNTLITYTMALHIGNTIYRSRGKTGEIISDTINFLFHIGKQFAQPGHLYVTDAIVPFIPRDFKDVFIEAGSFEGINMHTMRQPRSGSQ